MFGDRYLKFLYINQATQVNSKDDLINLLNSKPRSFLTGVQLLVNKFKNYENKLIDNKKQNKVHFKDFIMLNKKTINPISKLYLQEKNLMSKTNTTNKTKFKPQSQSQLYKLKSLFAILHKSYLIKAKISQLKQDLNNNNLPIPLNFLKPLLQVQVNKDKENNLNFNSHDNYNLDNNKLVTGSISPISTISKEQEQQSFFGIGKENSLSNIENIISKEAKEAKVVKESTETTEAKEATEAKVAKEAKEVHNLRLEQIINKSQISIFKQILESGIKTNYTDKINHFKNLIHNYHKNTNININIIVTLLEYAFRAMSCLISKPVFMITPNNIVINLFYYFIPGKVNKKTRKNRLNRLDLFFKDKDKDQDKDQNKDTSLNVNVNVNVNVNETLNLSQNQGNLETNIATEIGGISIVNTNNNNNNTNNQKIIKLSDKAK